MTNTESTAHKTTQLRHCAHDPAFTPEPLPKKEDRNKAIDSPNTLKSQLYLFTMTTPPTQTADFTHARVAPPTEFEFMSGDGPRIDTQGLSFSTALFDAISPSLSLYVRYS